jgi:hypothetical protein
VGLQPRLIGVRVVPRDWIQSTSHRIYTLRKTRIKRYPHMEFFVENLPIIILSQKEEKWKTDSDI